MKRQLWHLMSILMVLTLLLAACAAPTVQVEPTAAVAAVATDPPVQPAVVQPTDVPPAVAPEMQKAVVIHYFSDTLGKQTITDIFTNFTSQNEIEVVDNTTGHEDFKTQILVMLAGDNPPDIFSYWAGARVQFVVDSERLESIDELWDSNGLDDVVPPALAAKATMYGADRYLIPFGYHYAGLFYNPQVMADAGITEFPETWEGFITMLDTLKANGVAPIALGSKNRWPAQFWFDYLLLRTAGPEYREKLMQGQASYTDPEVQEAMQMWKELVDKGYFVENANAYDWTDSADQVANGTAAMTLMGTWITGYWNGNNLTPGTDYDFFPFPQIKEGVPNAVVGPVDGWVMAKDAKDKDAAGKLMAFLLTDPDTSAAWAQGQGALSPNTKVDPSIYNDVMKKASEVVAAAEEFAFNYDLATTPPMAEGGLNMFAQFMDNPADFADYLEQVEAVAKDVFKK